MVRFKIHENIWESDDKTSDIDLESLDDSQER